MDTDISYADSHGESFATTCECCDSYQEWKAKHTALATTLQALADEPHLYQILPVENVTVILEGQEHNLVGTIRALNGAPIGPCSKTASSTGPHPFTCEPCNALVHGKTSALKRKLHRSVQLKNPRCDDLRATRDGVNHKYCSPQHLQSALAVRKSGERMRSEKIATLMEANRRLLHNSWHMHRSEKPFVKTLITLLAEEKLSSFDLSFLKNWVGKKAHGRHFQADEQARNLAVLYSNKLGERMYTITAPLLGLPKARQAREIRAKETGVHHYLPGLNDWAFESVSKRPKLKPLQNGMDGTRIIRTVELYLDKYLVGKEFPPDVRLFSNQLVEPTSMAEVQKYILEVRQTNAYAAEAYSFNLSDTSGEYPDMLIGSIPESKSGVTGDCILALMLETEKYALQHNLPLTGHCTDSAGNALNSLVKLASPTTFLSNLPQVKFIGLPISGFRFFAPFLRTYPSIAYPCWDHSGRSVVRNLMNEKITIVCSVLPDHGDGMQVYQTASIRDLHTLKSRNPSSFVRHSDINRHVKQNCDATARILTSTTIEELATFVPESKGTQLFLKEAVSTHEPFRNDKFATPPEVVRSLWAGLMTWRRWRRYIQLKPELSLTQNFISRNHYMTEELLVHAGINHQLSLFFAFPHLSADEYSMRNTGNRGIEAIHSVFRGGSCALPITSPNLSFQDFLLKMNQTLQIHQAEHNLKQIPGNTIVASKKKRATCAKYSQSDNQSQAGYTKPEVYQEFVDQLIEACLLGDEDSKLAISQLATEMSATLQLHNEWDSPNISVDPPPPSLSLVGSSDFPIVARFATEDFVKLIDAVLGKDHISGNTVSIHQDLANSDIAEAYANLIADVTVTESDPESSADSSPPSPKRIRSLIKGMQPYRERPSKDRSRRFAAGQLPFSAAPDPAYDVKNHQYWAVHATERVLRNTKVFLLSQIVYISEADKPVSHSIKANPNTSVVLNVYQYNPQANSYSPAGRSALLKAAQVLHVNVNEFVKGGIECKFLDHQSIQQLSQYQPFHPDLDLQLDDSLSADDCASESDDPYIVESIVKKRYNSQKSQYEYFIKWLGYSSSENTWELPSNIPARLLEKYEQSLLSTQAAAHDGQPKRSGLRERSSRKISSKKDFILNT